MSRIPVQRRRGGAANGRGSSQSVPRMAAAAASVIRLSAIEPRSGEPRDVMRDVTARARSGRVGPDPDEF